MFNAKETFRLLTFRRQRFLSRGGLKGERHIFITHCHIDHWGNAAQLAEETGATLYLPRLDAAKIEDCGAPVHDSDCLPANLPRPSPRMCSKMMGSLSVPAAMKPDCVPCALT